MLEESAVPVLCQSLQQTNTDMLNNTLLLTVQNNYPNKMDIVHDQVEECGGLDSLERLQESQSEQIYTKAYRTISQFFSDDEKETNDNMADIENVPAGQNQWNF
ncbi:unnamed protein product [Caenorhabditis sp. 36 PRJEB53466]|nr:unnamed protein product [Caenorhabditis sp. 36 PRJEB53466]